MRIVFVYGNVYSWGGIQTWLTRMIPKLQDEGHAVGLLTRPMGEPYDVTSEVLDRLSAADVTIHYAGRDWFKAPGLISSTFEPVDVLFACSLEALLLAALVQRHVTPEAKIVAGVFAPREYCWVSPRLKRRWSQHLTERLVRHLPLENFMFSTDGMARQTGECLGRDLSRSPVVPLSVDTQRFRPAPDRRVDPHKIVSVARLAPYYTHHRQMITVIRHLRDQDHRYSYHAYGEGEAREALEAQARRLGVDDAVFFHGSIPYDHLTDAISDAFIYIGLGTALIEAAACGVPALVGIDSHSDPVTYGFIQDTEGNDIGGFVPGLKEHSIAERVLWLASRNEEEYRRACEGSRARAEEFSLTRLAPRLSAMLKEAVPFGLSVSRLDRALGHLDWFLEAILLNLGASDAMIDRHVRRATEPDTSAAQAG